VPSFTVTAAGQKVSPMHRSVRPGVVHRHQHERADAEGRFLTRPSEPAKAEWLSIVGESVRDFAPNAAEQAVVKLAVPPTSPPGSYSFRLDAVSEVDPDEDFTEGPSVAFDVAAPPAEEKKKFPWWILAIIGGVVLLIIIGVVVFLLVRGGNGGSATPLVGDWRNVDPNTRSTTHYVIAKNGDSLSVSGYGLAHRPIATGPSRSVAPHGAGRGRERRQVHNRLELWFQDAGRRHDSG
jgi:hypothetical protein